MKLGRTDESNPAHWFAFAAERLLGADVLSQHEGTAASSVEALQEAAERYLKGFLISKGWTLKRTHDLKVLVRDAAATSRTSVRISRICELESARWWR